MEKIFFIFPTSHLIMGKVPRGYKPLILACLLSLMKFLRSLYLPYLPPANEVCECYVFTPVCQSFCSQRGMRGCGGGHVWLQGGMCGCWGVHGCRGVCMVAGTVCMDAGGMCGCGGCAWFGGGEWLPGGMRGFGGWGMHGSGGACMVVGGWCAWDTMRYGQ